MKKTPPSLVKDRKEPYADLISDFRTWQRAARSLISVALVFEADIRGMWERQFEFRGDGLREEQSMELRQSGYNRAKIYLMLVGFAFENQLKAVIVKGESDQIREEVMRTGKLPKRLKGHDLLTLQKEASLHFNAMQESFCRKLTEMTIWMGRYPFPITPWEIPEDDSIFHYGVSSSDIEMTHEIIHAVEVQSGVRIT